MKRFIDINLSKCVPCVVCDQIVPGLKPRIEKSGPLLCQGWAWLEQSDRVQLLVDSCPCNAIIIYQD